MSNKLFDAIRGGDLHSTRELLEVNEGIFYNVNMRNSRGATPLHVAIRYDRHQIAKFLIQEKKADVNAVNLKGRTPWPAFLDDSNEKNTSGIAELLLANGASGNTKVGHHGATALHQACLWGKTKLIHIMMNNGVSINARDDGGVTPLYYACVHRRIGVIKLLLANNADRHIQDNSGRGPTDVPGLGELLTSYDKWPLAVQAVGYTPNLKTCKKRKYTQQDGAVRLNPRLSQHQHALALKALLLVRKLPVHEVAYQILGFLSPAAIEKIFLATA